MPNLYKTLCFSKLQFLDKTSQYYSNFKQNNLSKTIIVFIFTQIFSLTTIGQNISYKLRMEQPQTHYFEVEVNVENINKNVELKEKKYIDFKMPVWTPGSYLVREYAKNVEDFVAKSSNSLLKSEKISKNTWRVYANEFDKISISYKVYAYEMSVRTSFLDDSHGYLNGASVFMYVPQLMKNQAIVTIDPYKGWNSISTALKKSAGINTYLADDYDTLVDSPIEIGTHKVLNFKMMGISHNIAMYSNTDLKYDENQLLADYQKVTEAAYSVVGEHPCKEYTFIVHHLPGIGGGLEHKFSTTCQTSPSAYESEKSYKSFLSLIAHEYFHLWNIKRIRPFALGPFDYENENYTHMLWVSEGITSFYQENILKRANLITTDDYLTKVANGINGIENQPGNKVQSATESSWDAWIKYYRPNENSRNSTISYYDKGGVLGGLLNLYILGETKGKKSLDDVFRFLWKTYYKAEPSRGFTDEEFQKAVEIVAGKNMNLFFQNCIWGVEPIDYNSFFNYVGLKLVDANTTSNIPYFGANIVNGKVTSVARGSGAYEGGINVNDEIMEVDGTITNSVNGVLSTKMVGDTVKIKVKRFGQFFVYNIVLKRNPELKYRLEKIQQSTAEQDALYKKWLYEK